ncbi:S8 family peptidase [Sporosarcina sp. G11-34]|uniref:S8 family peptidase n=1 Tax=Sporosarcina sp. G11-34 TaxID=2849605 RepID=UPI0022A97C31|nr:S8 family serine peptidase [Sporosarcina sp. G11-34]MCZ2257569.1 S8 family serine peptidase [Sporosarcina sp. G11-34]
MRKIIVVALFICSTFLVGSASAEEPIDYLLHASKEDIQKLQKKYPNYTKSFEVIPMIEISLTSNELSEIRRQYSQVDVFPIREYEVAAVTDTIPEQFKLINTISAQTAPYTGKGVKVGVIDSGIDTSHKDLKVAGGICTIIPKRKCASTGELYSDDLGHGTHVAGVIAALKNGIGTIGIAPEVELYSIKTIDKGDNGRTTDIIAGIEWAMEQKIDILNMSITTPRDDPALRLMLEKAYKSGIILVAAAGNEGYSQDTVQYPAKYPTVIAVSAMKSDKTWLAGSSLGSEVELAAPGNRIMSTFPKNEYMEMSGTSMASPHVAGIAALLKERYPTMPNYKIRALLTNTAEDLGVRGRDTVFGYGLVNYKKLLDGLPIVSYFEDHGKIRIELSNVERTTNSKLNIESQNAQEISPGIWEIYKVSGNYKFNLSFKDENNNAKAHELSVQVTSPNYKDVYSGTRFAEQIAYLAHYKRTEGYPDQTFRPGQKISRAEAVALLGRVAGLNGEKKATTFGDVGINNFASGYIQSAVEKGYVAGFPDGTFRPNDVVTRAEMSLLLQQVFQFPMDESKILPFSDMTTSVTSYDAVRALTQKGIFQGYPDGTFRPGEPMTRAMYSAFLAGSERPELFKTN